MPIAADKIDRVGKEGRFVKRDVDFKPHAPREARFGEQQIAAACSAANCKIALGHANLRKRVGDCSGGNRLFVRGKSCCLSIGRVDHVAAEEEYGFRRLVGLNCGHRDTIGWTDQSTKPDKHSRRRTACRRIRPATRLGTGRLLCAPKTSSVLIEEGNHLTSSRNDQFCVQRRATTAVSTIFISHLVAMHQMN